QFHLQSWKDAEISPLLYEVVELTENNIFQFNMNLVNLKNRLLIYKNSGDAPGENKHDISIQAVDKFIKSCQEELDQIFHFEGSILRKMTESLRINQLYDKDYLAFRTQQLSSGTVSEGIFNN